MADYMLVFVPQKILSPLGILGQNIMLLCQYAERKSIVDNQLAIFIIFLFCLVSPSTVCTQCASFMRMLRLFFSIFAEFQATPIGPNYELQHVQLFSMGPFGRKYS